jgi:putative redox protein
MMEAKIIWNGVMQFTGSADSGFSIPLDASPDHGGQNGGFQPLELLLVGLAGCTGMDVISILQKKKANVTAFEVRVNAERAEEHPKVFTRLLVEYVVTGKDIKLEDVERSVQLSETKYCPAEAMLRKVAIIESKITIIQE